MDLYLLNSDEQKVYKQISKIRLDIINKYANAEIDEALNAKIDEEFISTCKKKRIRIKSALDIAESALNKAWFTVFIAGAEFTDEQGVIDFVPRTVYQMATSANPNETVRINRSEYPEFYRVTEEVRQADNPDEYVRLQREALGLPDYLYIEADMLWAVQSVYEVFMPLSNDFQPRRLSALSPTPSAYAFSVFSRLLNAGGRANPEGSVRSITSTNEIIDWKQGLNKNEWTVTARTKNSTAQLHIRNYGMFSDSTVSGSSVSDSTVSGSSKSKSERTTSMRGVKKVTRFILSMIMMQSANGKLPAYIDIDLNEMVEKKMYSRVDAAERGLEAAYIKMVLVDITQEITKRVKNDKGRVTTERNMGGGPLVVGRKYFPHNRARLYLQPAFDGDLFRDYSDFPSWAYALNDNAFELVDYVFRMLRINGASLKTKGYICLKLQTVSETMGLKTPEEVRLHHQRKYAKYIREPIETAVKEINATASQDKTISGNMKIRIYAPKTNDIEKWLTGEMRITADGEYAEKSLSLADRYESFLTAET